MDAVIPPRIGPFKVTVEDGVALVVFDRPPVNAVSAGVYEALGSLVDAVGASAVKVVVLAAPETARAWCGGADLHDFEGIDEAGRRRRYDLINRTLPRLYDLDRPVIAAVNGPAVGVGVLLAGVCDLRIGADDATVACPEIDYGLVAGSGGLLAMLKVPEGLVRELYFTGDRLPTQRLLAAGFFNRLVPRHEVLPTALALARRIACKDLESLRARKRASNALEGLGWKDAYMLTQEASAKSSASATAQQGVRAFFGRSAP